MKKIIIESKSIPDDLGYNDACGIIDTDSGMILFHAPCSCCPNAYNPRNSESWEKEYAWVAPGEYSYECWTSKKHGKCLKINNMGIVPTRNPNSNHDNLNEASEIELHEGFSDSWRGSAGCLTMSPLAYYDFIAHFTIGDKGTIQIIDALKEKA